jgi:uncharacterized protein with HEPN domain
MQRDKEYLVDILEAAKLTLTYVNEKTMKEIINDTRCQDAVIHRLEIIGEAARQSYCPHLYLRQIPAWWSPLYLEERS